MSQVSQVILGLGLALEGVFEIGVFGIGVCGIREVKRTAVVSGYRYGEIHPS